MKKFLPIISKSFAIILLFFAVLVFFHPVLAGKIPFPGDLLVGHYAPWNSYSYSGYAPGGVPHKAQGIDVVKQLYPWKFFATESFKNGKWPLWNFYNFSGNPQVANFQTGAFYPLNIVFLLPFNTGWTIFIILQPLLAFLFMYLFLKNLKLHSFSASLGGLAFAFSLYMAVWIEYGNVGHTLLWLPFLLLLVDKLKEKFCLKYLLIFIFALSFSILAGYIQQIIYGFAVAGLYFIFRHFDRQNIKAFLLKSFIFLFAMVMAFLICSLQLLPTWEIFRQSARNIYNPETIKNLLLPWFYLVTVVVPDFFGNPANRNYWITGTYIERVVYIGLVPIFFAIYQLFCKKNSTVWFFLLMGLTTFLLAVNLLPAQIFYGLQIPILGTTVPTRILAQFGFAVAVLAAFGFEDYLVNKNINIRKFLIIPLFFIFLWIGILLLPKFYFLHIPDIAIIISKRNLLFSSLLLFLILAVIFIATLLFERSEKSKKDLVLGLRPRTIKNFICLSLLFFTIFDLFFFFQRITPFSPSSWVYPQTEIFDFLRQKQGIWRFWGYGTASIDTNFATKEKLYSPEGVDPLFINRYAELVSTSFTGKIKNPLPRADVNIAPGYGTEDLRQNQFRQRIIDLLGVRYILNKNENNTNPDYGTFPQEKYQFFVQKGVWQIYENKEVVPRIFLTSDYVAEKNNKEIINKILDRNFPLTSRLILEEQPQIPLDVNDKSFTGLKLVSYDSNKVVIETLTSKPKLLFLSDNYFPGWQATVDGKPTAIYRTDYTFRSVIVPSGRHEAEFIYQPESFYTGLKISLATLLVLVFGMLFIIITRRYDKELFS